MTASTGAETRTPDSPEREGGSLDQGAVQDILGIRPRKDSFDELEDRRMELAEGVSWRRRRCMWDDSVTETHNGFCINEVRVSPRSAALVQPSVAMAMPGLVDFEAVEHAYWQTVWAGGALRLDRGQKESRLFVNMRALTCSRSGAPRGPWEDLVALEERIESGEWKDEFTDLIPALQPTLKREDDTPVKVARYLPAFPPSWSVQADPNVLVSSNAGYFLNFPEEYEDGLSALHQPVGALYANEILHMPPWIERPCAVGWKDGRRSIELLGPGDLALHVEGSEPVRLVPGKDNASASVTAWRAYDGELPEAPEGAVDLVFSGAGLAHVLEAGTMQPPLGGAVVRLTREAARPWQPLIGKTRGVPFPEWRLELLTSRQAPLQWVLASGPKLLHDGKVLNEAEMFHPLMAGEFHKDGPPPTRFPYDATETRAPRTALGLTPWEDWVLVVVDGRSDMAHSVGCTLEELARLMGRLGCHTALNLDGGGSSVMAVEGIGRLDQLKPGLAQSLVNIPSDPGNRERIVPVAINIVK